MDVRGLTVEGEGQCYCDTARARPRDGGQETEAKNETRDSSRLNLMMRGQISGESPYVVVISRDELEEPSIDC